MVHRAALAVVLATVAACASAPPPDDPYSRTQLLKEPAVELVYPGATRGSPISSERERTLTGVNPASAGYNFHTSADPRAVGAFYDAELTRLGWLRDLVPVLSGGEDSAVPYGWCKPGMYFRLAFRVSGNAAPLGTYTARVVASRDPCPLDLGTPRITPPTAPPRSP